MDDQQQRLPAPPSRGELSPEARQVADRLQAMSVPQAERILERAIELESAAPGPGPNSAMSAEMLAHIAEELGIDVKHLRQAVSEELMRVDTGAPSFLDRLLMPGTLVAHGPVAGSEAAVRQVVDAWMSNHEGLRKRAEVDGSVTWERDRSLGATIAHALGGNRGTGAVRRSRKVVTTVRPATDTEQVVVVEADIGVARATVVGLLVAAVGIGAAATGVSSLIPPTGVSAGDVAAGAVTFGLLGGGVLLGARMYVRRMRDALERVVDAVRSPHLVTSPSLPFGLDRMLGMFLRRG